MYRGRSTEEYTPLAETRIRVCIRGSSRTGRRPLKTGGSPVRLGTTAKGVFFRHALRHSRMLWMLPHQLYPGRPMSQNALPWLAVTCDSVLRVRFDPRHSWRRTVKSKHCVTKMEERYPFSRTSVTAHAVSSTTPMPCLVPCACLRTTCTLILA